MRRLLPALLFVALVAPAPALADPAGTFDISGVNPDSGGDYTGTVHVIRTGETYKVVWKIADETITGIGVGMKMVDDRLVTGPASEDDTGLSIAYRSGDSVGTVLYLEQADGTWHGTWTYDGWSRVSTEDWFPRETTVTGLVKKNEHMRSVDATQRRLFSPLPQQAGPKG